MENAISERLRAMSIEEGPEPQAALRRLAVCRGGFTLDAARAILEPDDDQTLARLLDTLARWEFVTPGHANNGPQARYQIALDVILAVGEDERARDRHVTYYEQLVRETTGDMEQLEPEHENLAAAFEWLVLRDPPAAYRFWLACDPYLTRRGDFDRHLDWLRRTVDALAYSPDTYTRGAAQNSLGIAYQNYPRGDRRANLQRAIAAYQEALNLYSPDKSPLPYATTQNNLGTAYADLSEIEARAENLWRAIAAYEEALRYRTLEAAPKAYAVTQYNLGLARRDLANVVDRADNLRLAVAAYHEALRCYTPDSAPMDYAAAQNNLGNAYSDLASIEDRAENLRRAIAAYQEALRFRTPDHAPLAYAATLNNLGTVYRALSEEEDAAENLGRAIAVYEEALRYTTPDTAPLEYAGAQNNLGAAYHRLAQVADWEANMQRCIAAYEEALRTTSAQTAPLAYAKTRANLGLAYKDLGEIEAAAACWRDAEQVFRQVEAWDRADMMREWLAEIEA